MRPRFFIIGLALALTRPAHSVEKSMAMAAGPQYSDQLSEYVLDSEDFFELTLQQKIVYAKFFMNMMATIEDMQNLPAEGKTALNGPAQKFLQLFIATADAAGWRSALEGQPCLNSLNARPAAT